MCDQCSSHIPFMLAAGNGDILSFEDYNLHMSSTSASGLMIGR